MGITSSFIRCCRQICEQKPRTDHDYLSRLLDCEISTVPELEDQVCAVKTASSQDFHYLLHPFVQMQISPHESRFSFFHHVLFWVNSLKICKQLDPLELAFWERAGELLDSEFWNVVGPYIRQASECTRERMYVSEFVRGHDSFSFGLTIDAKAKEETKLEIVLPPTLYNLYTYLNSVCKRRHEINLCVLHQIRGLRIFPDDLIWIVLSYGLGNDWLNSWCKDLLKRIYKQMARYQIAEKKGDVNARTMITWAKQYNLLLAENVIERCVNHDFKELQ